jgi:hypothetical protein
MSATLLQSLRTPCTRVFSARVALTCPLGATPPVTDIRRGVSNHISVRVVHEYVNPDLIRTQLERYGEITFFEMKPLPNSPRWVTVNVVYADHGSAFAAVDDLEGSVFCGRRVNAQFPKYGHNTHPKPWLKTDRLEKKANDKPQAKLTKTTSREVAHSKAKEEEEENDDSSSDSSDSDSGSESDSDSSDSDEDEKKA